MTVTPQFPSTAGATPGNSLDPRLRRLVTMREDPVRIAQDLAQSVVSNTRSELSVAEAIEVEAITTRVLVLVGDDDVVTRFPEWHWTQVVSGVYSVEVPVGELERLAADAGVLFVEAGRAMGPMLDTSLAEIRADQVHGPAAGETPFTGAGVIVGIIDQELDFTLEDFIDESGATRVAFLWDQSLEPISGERSPADPRYGVEYDADAINRALKSPDPFALIRHRVTKGSHGTHVAGIAAGNGRASDAQFPAGRYVGVAPEATIIYVQPHRTDFSINFTDSTRVADAISYVYSKADELGMSCVINMSLGQNGGSHDGESVVERAIDRLLEKPGRFFVRAAGNEHIWRGHASGTLRTGERRVLHWKAGGELQLPSGVTVPPGQGDFTPNELEIWYSSRDQIHVTLTSPDGEAVRTVVPGETLRRPYIFQSGNRAFITSERFSALNGDASVYIEVSPGTARRVTTGVWEVELHAVDSHDGRFDAFIERDARDERNLYADQSFFLGTDFDPVMTLGTPATTRRGIAVANYDHRTLAPSDSSGRGPTRDGRLKPELAAPGTQIYSSCALGGGEVDGSLVPVRIPMPGTSMSAPHVAGTVALMLERYPHLTAEQVRKMLIASAVPPDGVTPFDKAWGFGRLDAKAAVDLVAEVIP